MYGWVSYCLGIPVLFVAVAQTIKRLDGARNAGSLAAVTCLLFLAHAQLAAFYALIVAYLTLAIPTGRITTRLKLLLKPLSAPVLLGLPWVISRLAGQHNRGEVTTGDALIFHDPVTRLKRLPDFLTNCWGGHQDDWMGLATLGAVILLCRLPYPRGLSSTLRHPRLASGLVLMSAALYFLAPWEVRWPTNQWAIYNRFAIVTVMLSVLMIDVPFPQHLWRHRRWQTVHPRFWMIPSPSSAHEMKRSMRTSTSATPSSRGGPRPPANRRILPLVRDAGDPASHLGAADQSALLCDRTRWVRPLPVR